MYRHHLVIVRFICTDPLMGRRTFAFFNMALCIYDVLYAAAICAFFESHHWKTTHRHPIYLYAAPALMSLVCFTASILSVHHLTKDNRKRDLMSMTLTSYLRPRPITRSHQNGCILLCWLVRCAKCVGCVYLAYLANDFCVKETACYTTIDLAAMHMINAFEFVWAVFSILVVVGIVVAQVISWIQCCVYRCVGYSIVVDGEPPSQGCCFRSRYDKHKEDMDRQAVEKYCQRFGPLDGSTDYYA